MAYTDLATVRAMEGLDDITVFPDAAINVAIALAEAEIDRYCFTSFEYKAFTATVSGNNRRSIQLLDDEGYPILYLRTISSATVDIGEGPVAQTTIKWKLYPEGLVIRDEDTFSCGDEGRNIEITGTSGFSSAANVIIQWCCQKLARFHLLDDVSRVEERALSMTTDFGNINLSHASNHPDRPTALPEVNARLARYRQQDGNILG